jgi:hypothetical protein
MTRRGLEPHGDKGAALLSAIAFVLMVGAISAGLLGFASSSIGDRNTLTMLRDREYAADAAIEQAVTDVRAGASSGTTRSNLNGFAIRVDWQVLASPAVASEVAGPSVAQHNYSFAAVACATGWVSCDPIPVIRAQLNFVLDNAGQVTRTFVQSWSVRQ